MDKRTYNKKERADKRKLVCLPDELSKEIERDAKENFDGKESLTMRIRLKERYSQLAKK